MASPQNQYTGELWLGRAGGTSLGLPSLCDCCHPLSVHRCPLNHAAFTCLLIHKYTNTQIHKCFAVMSTFILYLSVCLVFRICIDCICISCTFDLLSFNPFGIFVFLEIRPKRQHSSQSTDFVLLWLFHCFLSRFSTVPAFPFCFLLLFHDLIFAFFSLASLQPCRQEGWP